MTDQFGGKKIPWSQFEKYLALHKERIVSLENLLANNIADETTIERMLPRSIFPIYELLSKVLRDNGILQI